MRLKSVCITATCCVLTFAVVVWAQSRKAGLYEVTTTMTWQQSPFPGGAGPGTAPHTNQVCVSQAQIDKYDGIPPQTRGDCQVTNTVKRADGYTASVSCSGQMKTQGTVDATYDGSGHGKTRVHLTGAFQMGPNSRPVEMTILSDSTYKGSDCGGVKPVE